MTQRIVTPRSEPPKRSGASTARTRLRDVAKGWFKHHRETAMESLQRMTATPVASGMTWLVIGIALALPAGLFVFVDNAKVLTRDWDGHAQISLYLEHRVSQLQQQSLIRTLSGRDDVARVELITPKQALDEFERMSGFKGVTEALGDNPLPPLLVVYPKSKDLDHADILRTEIERLPGVNFAQLDMEWVRRLHGWLSLATRVVWSLAIALAMAVILVVVNTIRLAIENRREEIIVIKLVGATDAFVRRPFLYTGLWYGLIGGVCGFLLVELALTAVSGPVDRLAGLYGSGFVLEGLGFFNSILLLAFGAFTGWLGSWIAVARHLRDIEPR